LETIDVRHGKKICRVAVNILLYSVSYFDA